MESQLQELYQEIAETVNNMIPEEWGEFYFYAQIDESGGRVYFFYKSIRDNSYTYSLDIPKQFNISELEFNNEEDKLFELSEQLREIFKENNQELWYSFTLMLEQTGKFSVSFDYTDWLNTDYGFVSQKKIWKYKYLDEAPADEKTKSLIDQYLKEYPNNPI
ncbi:antitoxin YezG family protein [Priestia aryabhattai]|uniref:antitoxin YezG family protein n=1 Tax=Priestia aryabhattai TaxID=412384 RepID=UPI002E24253E|nr:antitoxin YezG family protein [Priestia aryabhattai]